MAKAAPEPRACRSSRACSFEAGQTFGEPGRAADAEAVSSIGGSSIGRRRLPRHLALGLRGTIKILVGKTSTGTSRYAQKDGNPTIFTVSSFAGDWATAALSKFQKPEAGKDGGK